MSRAIVEMMRNRPGGGSSTLPPEPPPIDYALVTRLTRKHKAALTRARNNGDEHKIIEVYEAALADFEEHGYPDCWHRWESAKIDAELSLRYSSRG